MSDVLGVQFFDNGYGVSVICTQFSYGGSRGLYELAVLIGDSTDSELCYRTEITNDVLGYLSREEVLETIERVKRL